MPCMCGGCAQCLRDQGVYECPDCGAFGGCDCLEEPEEGDCCRVCGERRVIRGFCGNCASENQWFSTLKACPECQGTGRTSNHVTGEVECGACEGSGQDLDR